jgi:hypothetical protein
MHLLSDLGTKMDYHVRKIGLEGKGRQVFQRWQQYMEYYIMNMEGKQIDAILSDYDGTLCPTTSVRGSSSYDIGIIPKGLEQILFQISDRIPVYIVSSRL